MQPGQIPIWAAIPPTLSLSGQDVLIPDLDKRRRVLDAVCVGIEQAPGPFAARGGPAFPPLIPQYQNFSLIAYIPACHLSQDSSWQTTGGVY